MSALSERLEAVENSSNDSCPTGTIISYMGNNPPSGYVKCNGAKYDKNDPNYSALAAQIEQQFGSCYHFGGNDNDGFAVPNLQGEFLRGTGTTPYTNQGSGSTVGEHQNSTELRAHSFGSNNLNYDGSSYNGYNYADSTISTGNRTGYYAKSGSYTRSGTLFITSRPTNTSVLYCIKL